MNGDVEVLNGMSGALSRVGEGSVAEDVRALGDSIRRVRDALAGAVELTGEQQVRIRNRARAWVAELDLPRLHGLQIEMSILVQDAERAIGLAAEPLAPGRPRSDGEKCVISDHTFPGLSRDSVRQLRSLHTRLPDEQYAEVAEKALTSGKLLSRRAVMRKVEEVASEAVEEGGEPEEPDVAPPTHSATYRIEEGAKRLAKAFARRHNLVACAVVAIKDPRKPAISESYSLHGSWEVDASVTQVPGSEDVALPVAPAERAAFWADLMRLAGEWMRRTGPFGPLSEEDARGRALALYREEFGRWPSVDGFMFVPGVEPSSLDLRQRSARRFREFHQEQGRAGDGKSDLSHDDLGELVKSFEGSVPAG